MLLWLEQQTNKPIMALLLNLLLLLLISLDYLATSVPHPPVPPGFSTSTCTAPGSSPTMRWEWPELIFYERQL